LIFGLFRAVSGFFGLNGGDDDGGAEGRVAVHVGVVFGQEADGDLTDDGRWSYVWDAENRLIQMTVNTNVGPQYQLTFAYDPQGRRIEKIVLIGGVPQSTNLFLYDGWNLIGELAPNDSLIRSYVWGNDLSGSQQGAGGVGGLVEMSYAGTNCFVAYDGNGNVAALVNAGDGTVVANYEYGPFGELIRATGPMAKANPIRFSTKYQDNESDLVYYGVRYLKTSSGGWLSRDPINEIGFKLLETGEGDGDDDIYPHSMEGNLYRFVKNDPISRNDGLGLWPSASPWYGRFLNMGFAIPLTHENSDRRALPLAASDVGIVDAASVFVDNGQGTAQSYQHAMRAPGQSKAAARAAANAWVTQNLKAAQQNWCTCGAMNHPVALWHFGLALHTVQDSTSPAHYGFQVWHGLAPQWWPADADHVAKEAWDPGAGSNLDKATAWLWSFMTCPSPPLPADYFIFNEDWNWWYD
jgi:RHS repeat-associated protein